MDFPAVQEQLNDLPPTFTRPNAPYLQLNDAIALALTVYCNAADGTATQLTFGNAQYGWLDVWGLLFGLPRNLNEGDAVYASRIAFQVLAGAGPPGQIENWIQVVYGITATVTENFPAVGYTISFAGAVTTAQATQILAGLAYVRPAGVPITGLFAIGSGLIMNTINFFDAAEVIGGYLTDANEAIVVPLASSTNNAVPLLPTLFLTDPTLNPPTA
jgi:uncharacterized membrane protein